MLHFDRPGEAALLSALSEPGETVSAVFDTDTFNEVDDQYALAYAALAPNIMLEAAYAAPFHNKRSASPADGMEKSREEIVRLRSMLKRLDPQIDFEIFAGARSFLEAEDRPVASAAVEDLVERARTRKSGRLYVVAIAAPTNVASALLAEPAIRERIVVVWLGGQPYDWPNAWEFNLKQDLYASRVLFESGVPLVHVPCRNVAEHLRTSRPELAHFLGGGNELGEYLLQITAGLIEEEQMLSKVIWDIAPVAWLRKPGLVSTHLSPSPILTDQLTWSVDARRHFVRVAYEVDRDGIFSDLFELLAGGRSG